MELINLPELLLDDCPYWVTPFMSKSHGLYFLSSGFDTQEEVMTELMEFERWTGTFRLTDPMLSGGVLDWFEHLIKCNLAHIDGLELR